jgi:hypothetical protein
MPNASLTQPFDCLPARIPPERHGANVEAQRGADGRDVLSIQLLDNRRLASIVQPAGQDRKGVKA